MRPYHTECSRSAVCTHAHKGLHPNEEMLRCSDTQAHGTETWTYLGPDSELLYKEVAQLIYFQVTALVTIFCYTQKSEAYHRAARNTLFLDRWPIFISSEPNFTGVIPNNYSNAEIKSKFKCVYLSPFWINWVFIKSAISHLFLSNDSLFSSISHNELGLKIPAGKTLRTW